MSKQGVNERPVYGDYRDFKLPCGCPQNWYEDDTKWHHGTTQDPATESVAKNGTGWWFHFCVKGHTAHEAVTYLNTLEAELATTRQALEALAKVQYDGTVEGLRHQIEKEDWGDVLAIDETRAAYELTLEALAAASPSAGATA